MDFFKASNDLAQKFMGEFEHFGGDEGAEVEEPIDEPEREPLSDREINDWAKQEGQN